MDSQAVPRWPPRMHAPTTRWPTSRASSSIRRRFAEDAVARAVAAGTGQVVILGAGLDTFGCRNPHAGVQVYEVDHPSTQAWKRTRLAEAAIVVPKTLTFAPLDF